MLFLTKNELNPNGFWSVPLKENTPAISDLHLFDQNGYDLTELEKRYALVNDTEIKSHREHHHALKNEWFVQNSKITGAVLNHSLLFERKGYDGEALEELKEWAKDLPLLYKIIAMRPKWGLDFSMDYVDKEGNAFEVLHWEYDGFSYDEIERVRKSIEPILLSIDYDDAAQSMLKRKDEWHSLDFFAQSDWKCNYFGIPKERFKMVIWE
jgi:hypothetical protein